MNDKMLMEDWRKFLSGEEGVPSFLSKPWEAAKDRWRNEGQKLETESDGLLKQLEEDPFWKDIFDFSKKLHHHPTPRHLHLHD